MLKEIDDMLALQGTHVHLVGVCGVGMAGLAWQLKSRGFRVTGCDVLPNRIAQWLSDRGIEVLHGHDPDHITPDVGWLIRSAAVSPDCAEISHARESGLSIFTRGMVLPALLSGCVSVAVGGTHGKTTASLFIAQLLKSAGRDPSWCIGGECESMGVSGSGTGGAIVVEADESDGTLALYKPDIAVVTNVEFDHMEHFENKDTFEDCFKRFVRNAKRLVVFCADDPRATRLFGGRRSRCGGDANRHLSYGFSGHADIRALDLHETSSSLDFMLERGGKKLGRVQLPVIGSHNALNALAAVAVAFETGLNLEEIREGLKHVHLPRRRLERVVEKDNVLVISDYAHHPSEILALVQSVKKLEHSRLLAVFQPHRYTRTLALGRDFPRAFEGVDELILTPVYAASEKPLKGGRIWDLYACFRECTRMSDSVAKATEPKDAGYRLLPSVTPMLASSLEEAWGYLKRELKEGTILLVIGAGDIEKVAEWAKSAFGADYGPRTADHGPDSSVLPNLTNKSTVRYNEPLANKTSLRVGGRADIWVEVGSVNDLTAVLGWVNENRVPCNFLGGGNNVLISDLGLRGITVRLTGSDFTNIKQDDNIVVAGSAVPLSKLLDWLEKHGIAGLEFLHGIPGTVGGALHMNAGAWKHEFGEYISWVRCLNMDGTECVAEKTALGLDYRRCTYLKNRVLVEVGLTVARDDPAEIRKRRSDIAERRKWMKGLRSAGSIFKNPDGDSAGRLIDKAGLKGVQIGGAAISIAHANVIVTRKEACSSDVKALIEKVRAEVGEQFGVCLDTEIVEFD